MNTTTNTDEQITYITLPVTINGETREIEFQRIGDRGLAWSLPKFACRKGNGTKLHRTAGAIRLRNGEWKFDSRSGYALNYSGCPILAFADQVSDSVKSKHAGTGI